MRSIAHIINIFKPPTGSDLVLAQEVTTKTMTIAKELAVKQVNVELLCCCFEEDSEIVPNNFTKTSPLTRSVLNLGDFNRPIALPVLKDILDRLYNETDAEFLVFTNVDISVQPDFYLKVCGFIEAGHDAFIINRRRIPAKFNSTDEIEQMYELKGMRHPGFDCFIFHRTLYPKFSLAEVVIGVPFIGITLAQNLFCFANNPKVFTDEYLTFHIGLEIFKKRAPKEYLEFNREQFWRAMNEIMPRLDSRKWPNGKWWLPFRMIYWGLHPSLPIRLALILEPRRW